MNTGDNVTDLPRSVLDRAMRSVLAQLELVSNGTTTSYNQAGGISDNPDPRPRGGTGAPHLYWRRQYGLPFCEPTAKSPGATSDLHRTDILDQARLDLQQLTGRGMAGVDRPAGESQQEYRARILDETEGCSPGEVAQSRYAINERTLRKWRLDDGRSPETGLPRDDSNPVARVAADERRQLVAARKANGMTLRQIAFSLGISHETVRRDLRSAA